MQMFIPYFPSIPHSTMNSILFILTTLVQFKCGSRFYVGAWAALKHLGADMNVLVAVGTSTAYFYSAFVTFFPTVFPGGESEVYYETAAVIITLIATASIIPALDIVLFLNMNLMTCTFRFTPTAR